VVIKRLYQGFGLDVREKERLKFLIIEGSGKVLCEDYKSRR
jgi:hypothetical protein